MENKNLKKSPKFFSIIIGGGAPVVKLTSINYDFYLRDGIGDKVAINAQIIALYNLRTLAEAY